MCIAIYSAVKSQWDQYCMVTQKRFHFLCSSTWNVIVLWTYKIPDGQIGFVYFITILLATVKGLHVFIRHAESKVLSSWVNWQRKREQEEFSECLKKIIQTKKILEICLDPI